jgi:hypothetical protein
VSRIFLLSPATCSRPRAQLLISPRTQFDLAVRLRLPDGAPLAEVFTFLSGLYFRGKIAYAQAFAQPPRRLRRINYTSANRTRSHFPADDISANRTRSTAPGGVFVITPSRGLQLADHALTAGVLGEFGRIQIDTANDAYRRPLEASARLVAQLAGKRAEVVLLGSIATGKYVDVLLDVFGDRLLFPSDFVGRGDMSRGGLMLRCARAGQELAYVPVRGAVRHGARPRRLEPLRRRAR